MLILGFQGSPRKKGNTDYLLSAFLEETVNQGAKVKRIDVCEYHINPCRGCGYCEKKGFCVIQDDDMKSKIYPMLRAADIIVMATPIFFYSTTAQLKALIDRTQSLWSRKYKLGLTDPGRKSRKGFMLALGATKGKNLFNGLELTAKYFFDAVGAEYSGSLTYRHIEERGDMKNHPSVLDDIRGSVTELIVPFSKRKKILFACRENACRSQMASAFARYYAGDRIEALSGGSAPANEINPEMINAMAEKGIDMAYIKPISIERSIAHEKPDMIITMGCKEECPLVPGAEMLDWDLPDPAGQPPEFMRKVRDDIEKRVQALVAD